MTRLRLAHPLLIRAARLSDSEALHGACFPEQPADWVEDYLRWCLSGPGRPTRLVALLEAELVGHVELMARQEGRWAELSSLVVTPRWQRHGFGRRVVGAAARLAARWGCEELRLQVLVGEQALIERYRGWGFRLRGAPLAGRCWLSLPLQPERPPVPPTPLPQPLLNREE